MGIKKTDVFSGIGVFVIQMIANGIWYAFQKNNIYLGIGILFAIIVSVFVMIIIALKRKLKKQEESFNEQIDELGIDDLRKEKEELLKSMECLKNRISDVEQERDEIEQEIERLDQELELFKNKCEYYINTDSVNRKILYSLKNKKKYETTELQTLVAEIEYIFRDDVFSKKAKMNTSIFRKDNQGLCTILLSTKHSPGTMDKLKLDVDSLVGTAFNEKRTIYCGDINNRRPDVPFVELDGGRQYHSILAIPLIVDDSTEFVLVITCTNINCLEETYNKYQDVIQRYLELLCILLFISSDKEEL
jgi:GAF domain-containing protein